MDNRGVHTARRLQWPDHVRALWLPPDGPVRNPLERVWRDLKDDWPWQQFRELDAPQRDVGNLLQAYDAPTLQVLSGFAYVVEAIHALSS